MQSPSGEITVGQCSAVPSTIRYISSSNRVIADDVGYGGNQSLAGRRPALELRDTVQAGR
jgi:hypothetical protein